jgi:hypothetical protein
MNIPTNVLCLLLENPQLANKKYQSLCVYHDAKSIDDAAYFILS